MKLFPSQEALDKELTNIKHETGPQLGLVSADVPLISNLVVWQNIALVCQYQQNISEKRAKAFVLQCLQRFELESIADKKNPSLTEEERFLVMLLRASMIVNAIIVIDRPLRIIHYLEDVSFIYKVLEKIDDMFSLCFILDYNHDKNKYGMTDASES